jgi:hypothetical protein
VCVHAAAVAASWISAASRSRALFVHANSSFLPAHFKVKPALNCSQALLLNTATVWRS